VTLSHFVRRIDVGTGIDEPLRIFSDACFRSEVERGPSSLRKGGRGVSVRNLSSLTAHALSSRVDAPTLCCRD
jgi:hypothetical protein